MHTEFRVSGISNAASMLQAGWAASWIGFEVDSMWRFQSKRNALRDQLLLAPESNPSEFIRRYLAQKEKSQLLTAQRESKYPEFLTPARGTQSGEANILRHQPATGTFGL